MENNKKNKILNILRKLVNEGNIGGGITLKDIYDEEPDFDELLWEYIDEEDFHNITYPVVTIDPVEWYNTVTVDDGETTIKEAYINYAEPEQKSIVQYYKKNIDEVKESYLVVCINNENKTLIDGFHRLVAMAHKKIRSVKAVNICSDLKVVNEAKEENSFTNIDAINKYLVGKTYCYQECPMTITSIESFYDRDTNEKVIWVHADPTPKVNCKFDGTDQVRSVIRNYFNIGNTLIWIDVS